MALLVIVSDKNKFEDLPLTLSNNKVGLGNSNITLAQFEYNTSQLT